MRRPIAAWGVAALAGVAPVGCGSAPPPTPVVDPVVVEATPSVARGVRADERWVEARDAWLATHRAAVSAEDAAYVDFACDPTHVGTAIVGTCLETMDHYPHDFVAFVVADEGVLALSFDDLRIVRDADADAGISRRLVATPVLGGDPAEGPRALRRGDELLGVVTLDETGPHFARADGHTRFADTVCGPALVTGGRVSLDAHLDAVLAPDGTPRPRGACEEGIDAILTAARTGLAELDATLRAAAMAPRGFAAPPEAPPTCAMPSSAQLARAQRLVLRLVAQWQREEAAERRAQERDRGASEDDWGGGGYERPTPAITPASLRAALASARVGCIEPTSGAFLLELSAPDVRYDALWRIPPSDDEVAALVESRGGTGGGNAERIAGVVDADLTGDGVSELVVLFEATAVTDESTGDTCETTVSVYSPSTRAALRDEPAGCEPSANLSLPYAVLAPVAGDARAGLWVDGHVITWDGAAMSRGAGPFAAIATAAAAHHERYTSAAALAALIENDAGRAIACGGSDRAAWASDVALVLVRYGVAEETARAQLAALTACP